LLENDIEEAQKQLDALSAVAKEGWFVDKHRKNVC